VEDFDREHVIAFMSTSRCFPLFSIVGCTNTNETTDEFPPPPPGVFVNNEGERKGTEKMRRTREWYAKVIVEGRNNADNGQE